MAFERRASQYQPRLPPSDIPGGSWLSEELQRIANVFELLSQGQFFEVHHQEPKRPRTGMMVFADGTEWDPGSGRGVYIYDQEDSSWHSISTW